MPIDFNQSTELPRFMHKPHESEALTWVIYEYKDYKGPKGGYDAVGSYRVVDKGEGPDVTFKKLETVCGLLNGRQNLENFGNLTDSRLLFTLEKKNEVNGPSVITFRTHTGQGVSQENAVLTLEKGVLNE
jgi:hypothetical protein